MMHWKWQNKLKYKFGCLRPFCNGRYSVINSRSPDSSDRLDNLEKRSFSYSQMANWMVNIYFKQQRNTLPFCTASWALGLVQPT
jgi:hypothetical protein